MCHSVWFFVILCDCEKFNHTHCKCISVYVIIINYTSSTVCCISCLCKQYIVVLHVVDCNCINKYIYIYTDELDIHAESMCWPGHGCKETPNRPTWLELRSAGRRSSRHVTVTTSWISMMFLVPWFTWFFCLDHLELGWSWLIRLPSGKPAMAVPNNFHQLLWSNIDPGDHR